MLNNAMNLQEVIYNFLSNQIEFGAYRYGDSMPTIEETSRWFSISLDTVRHAYLRLKREGMITLTKKSGAAVAVQYDAQEIEQHIQTFFSQRRDAVNDLCSSLAPLFGRAQLLAFKNTTPEQLDELERLCAKQNVPPAYAMIRHFQIIYSTLHNDLLLRLVWQSFMFFQGPFLSLPENIAAFENGDEPLLAMIDLCRQRDWSGLWRIVAVFQERLTSAINQFYENRITLEPSGQPVTFHWNVYQKSSQLCYSLAMELLKEIGQGLYPVGTFLPSQAKIAAKKKVSVMTIRRSLELLNQLGATRSKNGVGTKVLNTEDSAVNCDFSQPAIQKRLLDFVQSLHILMLTCKASAEITIAAMDVLSSQQCKERLLYLKQIKRHESVVYTSLQIISEFAPIQAVREIYKKLVQLLFWGYPLRGIHGSREYINAFYLPYIDSLASSLERMDSAGFARELDKIMRFELDFMVKHLNKLGILSASNLVIPEH